MPRARPVNEVERLARLLAKSPYWVNRLLTISPNGARRYFATLIVKRWEQRAAPLPENVRDLLVILGIRAGKPFPVVRKRSETFARSGLPPRRTGSRVITYGQVFTGLLERISFQWASAHLLHPKSRAQIVGGVQLSDKEYTATRKVIAAEWKRFNRDIVRITNKEAIEHRMAKLANKLAKYPMGLRAEVLTDNEPSTYKTGAGMTKVWAATLLIEFARRHAPSATMPRQKKFVAAALETLGVTFPNPGTDNKGSQDDFNKFFDEASGGECSR